MDGWQLRRNRQQSRQGVLPLHRARNQHHISHTLSLWYCDVKVTAFNDILARLGSRHARFLRLWFSIGTVFSMMSMIGITLILLWELILAAHPRRYGVQSFSMEWLFGMPQLFRLNMSILDFGVMVYSTLAAIFVHELGHALAAARLGKFADHIGINGLDNSQGIQVAYVAMFLVVIFPGAFVAFNYDSLQNSTLFSSLRVYCAGIWHNLVLCAVCWSTLLLMPIFLHPFYIHGEGPVILNVAPKSPISTYLARGDVVIKLDENYIHDPQQWVDKLVQMDVEMSSWTFEESLKNNVTFTNRKGYCIPTSEVEDNTKVQGLQPNSSCPDDLPAFVSIPCYTSSLSDKDEPFITRKVDDKRCLVARDVVKLKKCGDGWEATQNNRSCTCLEDELCMAPIQIPGTTWVEISFSRPYSSECLNNQKNQSSRDTNHSSSYSALCGGTFVYVGDTISLMKSVILSAYRPRLASGILGLYLPMFLEKVLYWTCHLSASLALFNSLPSFFLDGESILETCLLGLTYLRPRIRRRILRLLLYGGSVLFIFASLQIFFSIYRKPF